MEEIKNKFYLNLNDKKEEFKILFQEEDSNNKFEEVDEFNKKLKKFIKLQKDNDEIDLSFVCFHEYYNFLDESSSFTKILKELELLTFEENQVKCRANKQKDENKKWARINKAFNFGNAVFYKRIEFIRVVFEKQINFEGVTFENDVNFENAKFIFKSENPNIIEVNFEGIICKKEAIFNCVEFYHKVSFFRARFYDYSSFKDATFYDEVDFENTVSKDIFFFHNVKLGKISLIGSHLENANFLRLKDKDKKILQKDNFQNKDSVRLVKAQYEKENNTTEVNWSFPLEQEFYLDLLSKEKSYYPSKNINKISLLIHKHVSNYGTDWVRVLIVLFGFGFLLSFIYTFFHIQFPQDIEFNNNEKEILIFGIIFSIVIYYFYNKNQKFYKLLLFIFIAYYIQGMFMFDILQNVTNKIATLINPLNIFKPNKEYFKEIVLYGIFVKAIVSTLVYQFIISFRNSTRRK